MIDHDDGAHMRPMPGMVGPVVSGLVITYTLFFSIIFFYFAACISEELLSTSPRMHIKVNS